MSEKHERIVTIGGGTGSPVINEALLRTGKVDNIDAVAAVYDSGGATGRRRLDANGREIAYSDPMRILHSLVMPDQRDTRPYRAIKNMMGHRDERDKVLGQEVFHHYFDNEKGFADIEELMEAVGIDLRGHVLPSSTKPSNIVFTTSLGQQFEGEHFLDEQSMSPDMVDKISLSPEVDVFPAAAEAIKEAEVVVYSSGSLHGSVLANLLPNGMKEAIAESKAKMYMVTNLVSTRNETHEFTPNDFLGAVERYAGKRPDGLIVPEITRREFESQNPRAKLLYHAQYSHFLGWEPEDLSRFAQQEGVEILQHSATAVVEGKGNKRVVRHDPQKLADTLAKILPE
jgi:uncharacterized cofD-like protein